MTYWDYVTFVAVYLWNHPEQRKGQAAFNVLAMTKGPLSDEIRGTDLDPFYVDERLDAFLSYVGGQFDD